MATQPVDTRTRITDDLIQEVVQKIVRGFDPKRIIVFGSQATGKTREDSDLDLFVEMDSEKRPVDRTVEMIEHIGPRFWAMDLFVLTPQEVAGQRGRGTLVDIVEEEGKVLYERE